MAKNQLKKEMDKEKKEFLESKVLCSDFYFDLVLPRVRGLRKEMLADKKVLMRMKETQFTSGFK